MTEESEKDITQIPKAERTDLIYGIFKGSITLVPGGGPISEIFASVVIPPFQKRVNEWIQTIAISLVELQDRFEDWNLEELSQNEQFVTIVAHATQTAVRNHQKEKLEALRNAVINSAFPASLEEDLQLMFIHFIDEFTSWHFILLSYLKEPRKWIEGKGKDYSSPMGISIQRTINEIFPELKTREEFTRQIVKDLRSKGLISIDSIDTKMSVEGALSPHTTEFGNEFLLFISEPN